MKSKTQISLYASVLLSILLIFGSCNEESVDETVPRNFFSGVIAGVPFANNTTQLYKDNNDLFTFVGTAGDGSSIFAFINGNEAQEYPVTQGELKELAVQLDGLTELDSSFSITLIALVRASLEALPEGESFALVIGQTGVFYANRGSITITKYDGSINRLYGEFDIEATSQIFGPVYIQADFEDVFFTECPEAGLCFF